MVILAVATRQQLRTKSNVLLACLAGTDLLPGLVVYPIAIAVEVKRILGIGPFCTLEKLYAVASFAAGFTSFSHLVLISIDRYVAIKHSLRYEEIVTTQRIQRGVLLAWAMTVCLTIQDLVSAFTESDSKLYSIYLIVIDVISALIGLVYIAVIFYTNCYIFSETCRQKKRLQTEQLPYEEAKRVKKDNKTANTLAFILGALTLSYVPSIIVSVVTVSLHNPVELRILSVMWSWLSTFVLLGSLFNPVIYCWRHTKLRHACLEILHLRQPENHAELQMAELQRHRPNIQPSTSEAFSISVVR